MQILLSLQIWPVFSAKRSLPGLRQVSLLLGYILPTNGRWFAAVKIGLSQCQVCVPRLLRSSSTDDSIRARSQRRVFLPYRRQLANSDLTIPRACHSRFQAHSVAESLATASAPPEIWLPSMRASSVSTRLSPNFNTQVSAEFLACVTSRRNQRRTQPCKSQL